VESPVREVGLLFGCLGQERPNGIEESPRVSDGDLSFVHRHVQQAPIIPDATPVEEGAEDLASLWRDPTFLDEILVEVTDHASVPGESLTCGQQQGGSGIERGVVGSGGRDISMTLLH